MCVIEKCAFRGFEDIMLLAVIYEEIQRWRITPAAAAGDE